MERPDQVERKISFNPEAAAFSPTTNAMNQAEGVATATRSAARESSSLRISAVPRGMSMLLLFQTLTDYDAEDIFQAIKNRSKALLSQQSDSTSAPLQLQDLVAESVPENIMTSPFGGE